MANREKIYSYYSTVTEKEIEWLWYPYIPYGKITVIEGDPGDGKSTFILNVASLLTKGADFPDGFKVPAPQTVIYQCSEDDLSDTIKPRLIAAGADCERVAYIIDDKNDLNLVDSRIEKTLAETKASLFVLDPLQSYLVQDGDMQSAGRMRNTLGRLSYIAAKYHCAVVLVGHMNKKTGDKNLYRGLGSIDIAAIARSVLMIERDCSNKNIRYMLPIKSNIAAEGKPVGFSFENEFHWIDYCGEESDKVDGIATSACIQKKKNSSR